MKDLDFKGTRLVPCGALVLLAVLICLMAPSWAAATVLPEKITENMTLTAAGGPYTGSPTVEGGVTLTIKPGTVLKVEHLEVKGTLLVEGTAAEPVVFTGAKGIAPGEWCAIYFAPGSGASVVDHAEVQYGGACGTGDINVEGSSPTIKNSTISHSSNYGINVPSAGSPEIANNHLFANSNTNIRYKATGVQTGEVNIHGNTIEGGPQGIEASITSTGVVAGKTLGANTITGTTGKALYYSGADIPGDITGNTLFGNKEDIIRLAGTVAHSETWNSGSAIQYEGEVLVAKEATLTITQGVFLINPKTEVQGTLLAEGTATEPVIFSGAKETAGEWCSIAFRPGSGASVINHAEVKYGGACGTGDINVEGGTPTIKNSIISHSSNYGINVPSGGSPEIANNDLFANANTNIRYLATSTQTGEVNIHGNTVEGGPQGIYVSKTGSGAVTGKTLGANTITGTTEKALYYNGADIPGDITGNTLSGNKENIIRIGGTVAHSETWNNGGSPVLVESLITVASEVTLTITKGVRLMNPKTEVKGTLLVEGTAAEPVIFTGAKEATPGEWCAIYFAPGSGASVINHAEVKYGGACGTGDINVEGSSPTIKNSTISHSSNYGISVPVGGGPELANNHLFANSNTSIRYLAGSGQSGQLNIHGNTVEGGAYGIYASLTGTASVAGKTLGANTITGTTEKALYYNGADIPGDITGNTLAGNKENIIRLAGTVAHSETWNSGSPVKYEGEVVVASGATLTITKGVLLLNPKTEVKGTLLAEGTSSEPVIFTGAKEAAAGEWCSIALRPGSGASVIDHAEVKYGGACGTGDVNVEGGTPTIRNSTISHSSNYGIKTEKSTVVIEWNRFRADANNAVFYTGTGNLSAPHNDWNCASGPKPAGCGETVASNIKWEPAVQLPELGGKCRGKESQCGEGADPVSLATGQLDYSHQDLLLTNKSTMPLEFTRTYSSGSSADTGLGPGWSQTGLASATELESGEVLVVRQDGRQDLFQKTEAGYKAPSGVTDALAKVEGTFQLTTLDQSIYRFGASGRIASITDSHGLKTTYGYDANGRLATITDPSGQTLTFSYNASNHITAVKDSTGREVKFGYSLAGDLETVTDALGGVTKYAYDPQHRLISITDPRSHVILKNVYNGEGKITEQEDGLGHLWKLEYAPSETTVTEPEGGKRKYGFDSQDRVVSETDQLGHTTTIGYDAAGNVEEVVKPGGAKWTFGHDASGNLTSAKDPEGGERKYEYDAKNHLIHYTDARGSAWSYEWSAVGDLTKITDPEGSETTLTYNESGQPLTLTDPDEHKTEFSWDSRGNKLSQTDPLGHKTSFEYNARNYLTAKTLPGLKAETFEVDTLGDVLARTTPEGHKTKYTYDANGLPTQITDPAEDVWKIERDAMERPTTYTDPAEGQVKVTYNGDLKPTKIVNRRGKETTYAYNLAGELTEVARPEGEVWKYGYDARGNRSSVTDPRGHETTYEYDLLDRLVKSVEPLETTTKYGYDANGELTSLTDPRGNTTSYAYDKLGRLVEIAQPLEKKTTYAYDAASNPLSKTTAAGTLEYTYDAANRLTQVSAGEATLDSYGYDAANRLSEATDAEGHKIEIGHNEDSLVSSITDGRGQSLTRSYNSRGLLTKQVDGRGTLEYGYDKLGRLTSLTDPQGKALGFAYDPEGDLTEVTRPNGVSTANVYDNAGRLAETTSQVGELPTIIESLKYGYDAAGNVTSRLDRRSEAETTYAYDALNRLTEFNPPGEGATSYAYDAAGNRTEAGPTTYSYNALNELTESSDGTSYGYDGAGRLIEKVKGEEKTTYSWDLLDHLAKVEGPGEIASYAFDALGRLSERKGKSGTLVAHYGDLSDLPTYDANAEGETTTSYVQGPRGLVEERTGETTSYPLADSHGDITAITGPEGSVESRQDFDPWGHQLSGPTLEMGYLGAYERRADPTSGVIQMGARAYDPALGSFDSEDSVLGHKGIGISFDRHLYVWDNPLNRYDLNGRDVLPALPGVPICVIGCSPSEPHEISERARDFAKSGAGEWFGARGDEVVRTFECIAERVVQQPGPVGCQEAAEQLKPEPEAPEEDPKFPPPGVPGKDPGPVPPPVS